VNATSDARARIAIGLVGPLPPPSGGMANQTRQLARLLAESGLSVELVQVNAPYRPAWVGGLRGVRAAFRLVPYLLELWRSAARVDLFHVMANSGWAWHLFAVPAIWVAHVRRVPAIVNYRGGEAESFLLREARLILPGLARARAVVVPSGFLEGVFANYGIATEIVPNIVDLDRFSPAPPRPGRTHIVVTRNLEPIYDIPTAIRAFATIRGRYPDARLTIAGSGPLRLELEQLAQSLGVADTVRFTGRLDNEQLPDLYRSADLMLNPSTVDNMPISVLEAMASGVPIVSTNVGGVPFVVEDGSTALLVPPRNPEAMAAATLRIFDEPMLRERLRAAGIERARRYAWPQVRERLFAVYSRALGVRSLERCSP
jgi:glycosyltransferase involved in cell wall biosynthesis